MTHSPRLHAAIRAWHYLAPGVAVLGLWSVAPAAGRVWLGGGGRRAAGALPLWPVDPADPSPAVVVGEAHHPDAECEADSGTGPSKSTTSSAAQRFDHAPNASMEPAVAALKCRSGDPDANGV
ncbi:MAG: hypothetical protein OXH69_03370 [Acidobacteria bacterium]|nr:hypothetical protein [Acidobacteriota bacterium]